MSLNAIMKGTCKERRSVDQEGHLEIKSLPIKAQDKSVRDTDNFKYIPEAYKKVAGDLETQFNELMLQQMNQTIDRAEDPSTAEAYYDGLANSERAKAMSASDKGVGLKKMILDQIYPQRLRNETNYMAVAQAEAARAEAARGTKIKIYAQGGQNEQH